MKLTVLGSGDAFGAGGRLQTSLHLSADNNQILVDCGATTLIAMARSGLDPNEISTVVVTHLHGDHFSGLVWFLLHAQHIAKRTTPLTIIGPRGMKERLATASEALFPGSSKPPQAFAVEFFEHAEATPRDAAGFRITPFEVRHPSGAPPYCLRIESGGSVFAFSGDTEWTDALLQASADADVFICECFGCEGKLPGHITWQTLVSKLNDITARRIYLTHMGREMLDYRGGIKDSRVCFSEDGLVIDVAATTMPLQDAATRQR